MVSIGPEGYYGHPSRDARALASGLVSLLLALEVALLRRAAPLYRHCGLQFSQRCDDGLGLHALAEFDVDLPCRHQPIVSDNKLGRHRQEIAAISLIFLKFDASLFVQFLDLSTDPKDKAKRERIT